MRRMLMVTLLCFAALNAGWAQTLAVPADAASSHAVRTNEVTARLLAWAPEGIAAGQTLWLGVQLEHAPDWHTYWINPGQAGMATSLQWQLPQNWTAGDIAWPAPVKFPAAGMVNLGYDGTTLLAVPVQIRAVPQSDPVTVAVQANWLACRAECLPQQGELRLQLPVGAPIVEHEALFRSGMQQVPVALTGGAAQASVQAGGNIVAVTVAGLPAAWQGKTLNVYPEAEGVFDLQAKAKQRWQDKIWQLELPLDVQSAQTPASLALVVALQDAASAGQALQRNAGGHMAYRLHAPLQGGAAVAATVAGQTHGNASADSAVAESAEPIGAFAAFGAGLGWWLSMGAALLGGLLLNLMPCVFPVLGIKVLGFARHAHNARELRLTGLLYTAGCIASFLLLAGGLLALRAGGEQLGWGFQLQNPHVVAGLAALFTVLALNFLGVFEVGQWLPASWQDSGGGNRGVGVQAFFSGVLSVLVASPCSAPFVGAALGFALGLPAWQALAVFACLGLGLALPVLLASFVPSVLRWLPKPGQWMVVLRQWMAFPMLVTVVWLAWVLGQQRGVGSMAVLLCLLVLLAGLLWAWRQQGWARRFGIAFFVLALIGVGSLHKQQLAAVPALNAATANGDWQPWSHEKVQSALQAGNPVLVNYTAAWCITCQLNKKNVFEQESFMQLARQHRVQLLDADWTRSDPAITASLRSLGRAAVPTYAIYHPGKDKPQILTELLTLDQVKQALEKM